MIEYLAVTLAAALINALLKALVAFITWTLATWLQLPEWGTLCLIIMAVQSTHFKVKKVEKYEAEVESRRSTYRAL